MTRGTHNLLRSRFLVISIFLLGLVCSATADRLHDGNSAFKHKDYAASLNAWQFLAQTGNSDAQYGLGLLYEYGLGVPKDYIEAAKWYRQSAEQGNERAEYNLGVAYFVGRGVPKNLQEAFKWIYSASEKNLAYAQAFLGSMYSSGTGVNQDYIETFKWMNKAASNGDLHAQVIVGTMYLMGRGTDIDLIESYKWLMIASKRRTDVFENELDQHLDARELSEAKDKINKIQDVANTLIKKLSESMTSTQIADAQHRADEWILPAR